MMTRLLCATIAMLALTPPIAAQGAPVTASLSGRIVEAGDSTIAAVGASVELVGTALRRTANSAGRFVFAEVPPGNYEVRVQGVGYQPMGFRVELAAGQAVERRIDVARVANALTEVKIEGKLVRVPARYEAVFRRAARGIGKYFTSADIEQLDAYDLKSVLARVPTVGVNGEGVTFQRCQAGMPSPGGSSASMSQQLPKVQVYIDGQRMTRGGDPDEMASVLASIRPSQVEIMEVYTGVSRIPGEFNNDACAVIAIWRK